MMIPKTDDVGQYCVLLLKYIYSGAVQRLLSVTKTTTLLLDVYARAYVTRLAPEHDTLPHLKWIKINLCEKCMFSS